MDGCGDLGGRWVVTGAREGRAVMSLAEFRRWLAARADLDASAVTEDASLVEDLGFDSIRFLELLTDIEEAVGEDVVLPIELVVEIDTVRDAYLQYCALVQLPLVGTPEAP